VFSYKNSKKIPYNLRKLIFNPKIPLNWSKKLKIKIDRIKKLVSSLDLLSSTK
jgi:hypothetical protein